jgi:hypothetical protein
MGMLGPEVEEMSSDNSTNDLRAESHPCAGYLAYPFQNLWLLSRNKRSKKARKGGYLKGIHSVFSTADLFDEAREALLFVQ